MGVIQFASTSDRQKNFDTCSKLVRGAAERGANMVCLPGDFSYRGNIKDEEMTFSKFRKEDIKENVFWFKQYTQLAIDN